MLVILSVFLTLTSVLTVNFFSWSKVNYNYIVIECDITASEKNSGFYISYYSKTAEDIPIR